MATVEWGFFRGLQTPEAVEHRRRELRTQFHPDARGSHEAFVELERQYHEAIATVSRPDQPPPAQPPRFAPAPQPDHPPERNIMDIATTLSEGIRACTEIAATIVESIEEIKRRQRKARRRRKSTA